jgi:hypothetical protein
VAGIEYSGPAAQGGGHASGGAVGGQDVQPGSIGNLSVTSGLTVNAGGSAGLNLPFLDLARQTADLQQRQLEFQMEMQREDLALRREAQAAEIELRRQVIERADQNEKAGLDRLKALDTGNMEFAKRGQTFAMWLAGLSTGALLISGLVCIFLTVAGVIPAAIGFAAAGILIAGGVITGISNLVKHFLPGGSGDGTTPKS